MAARRGAPSPRRRPHMALLAGRFRPTRAMMQFARRASLIVVLLLLASVGKASAECAWVLWYSPNAPESWVREDAFESRATCVRTLDRNQRQYGEARVQRAS